MVSRRQLLIGLVMLAFALPVNAADELRAVIVAYRPDLLTASQKNFLRNQIDEYTLKDIGKDALKHYEVFIDGDGNSWRVMWWTVKQFRKAGLTVTLAAVKAKLKESQYADRIKIAIAPRGQAEALIESQGWHRPVE